MIDLQSPTQTTGLPPWLTESTIAMVTTVFAVVLIVFGFMTAFSTTSCVLPGILQLLVAYIIIVLETPAFVQLIRDNYYIQRVTGLLEDKPAWIKVAIYGGSTAVIFAIGALFGCGLGGAFSFGIYTLLVIVIFNAVIFFLKKRAQPTQYDVPAAQRQDEWTMSP